MKRLFLIILSLVLALPAQARKQADFKNTVGMEYLNGSFALYDALQKEIHRYAEPGYLEYRSSRALADHLKANGFSIEMGVAGIPTAFVATFGEGSPVIGLLGEYDALPGMSQDTVAVKCPLAEGAAGHACGHNLLGTAPAAAAVAISKWLAQGHRGTVKYFGCPAEEGGGGKAYMTKAGCFDGCDAFFDWHPGSRNQVSLSSGLANVRVEFTFHGTPSHASVSPWNGRSALDAVEAFDHMMNMMREHISPECRIHYIISNGGQAPNVVPDRASVLYYIRHPKADVVLEVLERAKNAARGAALGTGTTMTFEVMNGNYERLTNRRLSEIMLSNLKSVGGVVLDEREKAFCSEIMRNSGWDADLSNFEIVEPEMYEGYSASSSDVGNVSQMGPLVQMSVATQVMNAGLHSWQQTSIGGTTVGTKSLMVVAVAEYLTALHLYTHPEDVRAILDEYYAARGRDFKFVPLMGDRKPPLDYCKGK